MRLLEIALKCAVPCIRLLSVFCRPQGTEPAPAGGRVPCLRRKAQRRGRQGLTRRDFRRRVRRGWMKQQAQVALCLFCIKAFSLLRRDETWPRCAHARQP